MLKKNYRLTIVDKRCRVYGNGCKAYVSHRAKYYFTQAT